MITKWLKSLFSGGSAVNKTGPNRASPTSPVARVTSMATDAEAGTPSRWRSYEDFAAEIRALDAMKRRGHISAAEWEMRDKGLLAEARAQVIGLVRQHGNRGRGA